MRIKEVERVTGLTRANIRFYESKGLFVPERNENNYREYSDKDVDTLKKIVLLRKMGVSIEDLQVLIDGDQSLQYVLETTRSNIVGQIEDLKGSLELCDVMKKIRKRWIHYYLSPIWN